MNQTAIGMIGRGVVGASHPNHARVPKITWSEDAGALPTLLNNPTLLFIRARITGLCWPETPMPSTSSLRAAPTRPSSLHQ